MTMSGHMPSRQTLEQLAGQMGGLEKQAREYDQRLEQDLSSLEARLSDLAQAGQEQAGETRRQLQEVVAYVGRAKSQASHTLLELELQTRQMREALEKAVKEQSEVERQKLEIEKDKLHLERWKLTAGLAAAFLTGLLFPILLWWWGVGP